MSIAYYLILLLILLLGWMINIVGLPGLWLMVAAYGLYALASGWGIYVGWASLIAMIVLALLAEVAEFGASAAGSKAAGGRMRGMIGGVIGAFVGGILFSIFLPIWPVSTIIGAVLGAFAGALVMEFTDKEWEHAVRVGIGAAKGRLWAIAIKMLFGLAMFLVALFAGMPVGGAARVTTVPSSAGAMPATSPTTQSTTATLPATTLPATFPASAPGG
jgi:uncharacterized protein YqgC (DUF456 family)